MMKISDLLAQTENDLIVASFLKKKAQSLLSLAHEVESKSKKALIDSLGESIVTPILTRIENTYSEQDAHSILKDMNDINVALNSIFEDFIYSNPINEEFVQHKNFYGIEIPLSMEDKANQIVEEADDYLKNKTVRIFEKYQNMIGKHAWKKNVFNAYIEHKKQNSSTVASFSPKAEIEKTIESPRIKPVPSFRAIQNS